MPLLPVRPEQFLHTEPVPRRRRVRSAARCSRLGPGTASLVCRLGSATVTANQVDVSSRGSSGRFITCVTSVLMRCLT
jgi:hypothetical protein